ncbi:(d)CMP kinase [Glutamicibacter arilaitensis]|uniref:Cytidylate kinase n=1 Tax=Glutamicibacter arilaitensis TaxID=256701 RepID=A0A2N7S5I2_9MICC|nr:(d)CMP kinase [Glutamicibacter arilaitensis]TFH57642.1 (d)CMP kinase [Glutamicibacter arilaitensis]HCH47286.1 (d)CMP kinase [Glutamicibacter sp.]HCJ55464.1 (d)CMP kinase [Glutamicibacter sp.]HCM94710.1 (d)CMP kinase [Glutamicibacter sp.]
MESSPVSTLNNDKLVIAIDGPSGSGKSSVSKAVARKLGAAYLDTGAMYRAITYSVLADGTDLSDANAIAQAVRDAKLSISLDPDAELVQIGGEDVTAAIREPRISEQVSTVATNLDARAELVRRQQQIIAENTRIVAEGRDITTVVAPDADARILLTASEEARLRRRGLQLGGTQNESQLATQVLARDAKDSTVVNFTQAADGVMTVDSSDLDFEQTIDAVLDAISTATKN